MTSRPRFDDGARARGRAVARRLGKDRREHGWIRASDISGAQPPTNAPGPRRRAPVATPALMVIVVGLLTAIGIVRVHSQTRVLELGAEISELTNQQTRLLEIKRRLEAERAYLRHPDHVREVATGRLGMKPVEPHRIQQIELQEAEQP